MIWLSKKCDNCYFGELCNRMRTCSNYYPIAEESEDEYLYEMQEEVRYEYVAAWRSYMSEWQDD